MADTMTPSVVGMTDGELEKLVGNIRAGLIKNRRRFAAGSIQRAFGTKGVTVKLQNALSNVLEEVIVAQGGDIIRHIWVKADHPFTKRGFTAEVFTARPSFEVRRGVTTFTFFKLEGGDWTSDDGMKRLDQEYQRRSKKPPDPVTLAIVGDVDLELDKLFSYCTWWRGVDGEFCFLERNSSPASSDFGHADRFRCSWFAGVPADIITIHVKVDTSLAPQQAIDATGRDQYTIQRVVDYAPRATIVAGDVTFFKVRRTDHRLTHSALEDEYGSRNLKPVDLVTLSAVNADDEAFADDHPNTTHWLGDDDKWCYATFRLGQDGRRSVFVRQDRYEDDYLDDQNWFAGVPK